MRPKGFKNPFEEYHNAFDIPTVQDAEWEAFEAGADAYEKALKEGALLKTVNGKIDLSFLDSITSNTEGYLVFILEDE